MNFWKAEPAAITAAVTAIVGVLIITGVLTEAVGGAIVVAISAILLALRQMVTPKVNLPVEPTPSEFA